MFVQSLRAVHYQRPESKRAACGREESRNGDVRGRKTIPNLDQRLLPVHQKHPPVTARDRIHFARSEVFETLFGVEQCLDYCVNLVRVSRYWRLSRNHRTPFNPNASSTGCVWLSVPMIFREGEGESLNSVAGITNGDSFSSKAEPRYFCTRKLRCDTPRITLD